MRSVSSPAYVLPDRELVLGRYRPLRPLGRGGSGSVWLSRDEQTGRDVALKIVPREGKRASRAEREAEAASRLRHERCVRAYDFGGDSGHVYIAYEYVSGRTLREVMRAGQLDDRSAIEAAAQVLDGLAHAHARGIVHRDVKPSNVILEEGQGVSVRLLDFGLAQLDELDTLTAVGDVPGTLAYIPPERLTGGDATPASDVWAVGVMLWEALAGKHPFWGVPLPEVAGAIADGARPLSAERPDLAAPLLDAVSRALDPNPTRRPGAAELAHRLRDALELRRREQRPRERRPTVAASAPAPRYVRFGTASLTGIAAIGGAAVLPFWPPGLIAVIGCIAVLTALRSPRLGLTIVLAAPLFPLGNAAEAAAVVYGALALAWLVLFWRDARAGVLPALGALLAPLGLLALMPLAAQPAIALWRRSLVAFTGVLVAAAVAGLQGVPLPVDDAVVGDLGVGGSERPVDVVTATLQSLTAADGILATAVVLAVVTAAIPYARSRGTWGVAVLCAGQLAGLLLLAPATSGSWVVVGTWLLGAALLVPLPILPRLALGTGR